MTEHPFTRLSNCLTVRFCKLLLAGILAISSTSAFAGTVSLTVSNSILDLITNGTRNFTFTDPSNGLAVVVAVTMSPYSSSNANPAFTLLDFYGPDSGPVHAGVDSALGNGDGNWVDSFEGVNFSASLVSSSSGIDTNSIRFGIAALGLRPGDGGWLVWTSSATTNSWGVGPEGDWPLDTNSAPLSGAIYAGQLRAEYDGAQYQLSDYVPGGYGLVLNVLFNEGAGSTGSAATLTSAALANNQFQFAVNGTTDATYVVETATNLETPVWTPIYTNLAPFTFTTGNMSSDPQRFFRVVSP